ncbi:MAG: hypothetical protein ACK55Z_18160, partial [bacterium]
VEDARRPLEAGELNVLIRRRYDAAVEAALVLEHCTRQPFSPHAGFAKASACEYAQLGPVRARHELVGACGLAPALLPLEVHALHRRQVVERHALQ